MYMRKAIIFLIIGIILISIAITACTTEKTVSTSANSQITQDSNIAGNNQENGANQMEPPKFPDE